MTDHSHIQEFKSRI